MGILPPNTRQINTPHTRPVRFGPRPAQHRTAAQREALLAVLKRIAAALEHIANGVNR